MTLEFLEKLDELILEIQKSNHIKEIQKLDKIINTKYVDLINDFKVNQEKFNEVYKYGKYHPEYMDVLKSFGTSKENLYNKEEVKRYFILIEELREKLQHIVDSVAVTISPLGFNKGGNICVTI